MLRTHAYFNAWQMVNVDTGETIRGQFEPYDIVDTPGAPEYAGHTSLNRDDEILQFLHGTADTLAFTARFYAETFIESVDDRVNMLKGWRKKVDRVAAPPRPPIIVFTVGVGALYLECVVASVGGITYDRLRFEGSLRGATVPITLREYVPFEIAGEFVHETRYHKAKEGDYYELLAYQQYGAPALGDLVRRRHPDKLDLEPADEVALPPADVLRKEVVAPHSNVFKDAFSTRDTPAKRLRERVLDRLSAPHVSHVLKEY